MGVCKLFLGSWGEAELERWMRCRWEELARNDAFKAGFEDGAVQRGRTGGSEAAGERCY